MTKKTGLGKGLDALFANNIEIEETLRENESIEKLKITQVEPNRNQPRKHFDEEALEELAESIKRYGVIQPIIVVKKGEYYEIVAGERRWRASKKAGLTEIPAIVREGSERTNKEIALIENVQREDLNAYEKAIGIKELMEEYELTQQQVSEILGKSRSSIANTVRILNLDPRVIEMVRQNQLTEGHARSLLGIEDNDKQYQMALKLLETGESVREIEKKVQQKKKTKNTNEKYEAIYRDIEDSFQGFFGTKVKLETGKRKGKIVIEYANNEELERILELIK